MGDTQLIQNLANVSFKNIYDIRLHLISTNIFSFHNMPRTLARLCHVYVWYASDHILCGQVTTGQDPRHLEADEVSKKGSQLLYIVPNYF